MGKAVWRVTEKPKIAIFGPGPSPVRPHGEAGLDGLGVLSCLGSPPGGTTQNFWRAPILRSPRRQTSRSYLILSTLTTQGHFRLVCLLSVFPGTGPKHSGTLLACSGSHYHAKPLIPDQIRIISIILARPDVLSPAWVFRPGQGQAGRLQSSPHCCVFPAQLKNLRIVSLQRGFWRFPRPANNFENTSSGCGVKVKLDCLAKVKFWVACESRQ